MIDPGYTIRLKTWNAARVCVLAVHAFMWTVCSLGLAQMF